MRWVDNAIVKLRSLLPDRAGATGPIIAIAGMALIAAAGVAVDIGRSQVAQAKLQSALDAAGLAAGSSINTTDLDAEVEKYLDANFAGETVNATLVDFVATPNDDNTLITLTATATMPATVMQVFGHDEITISASTEVTREMKGMEVALVLDVTGSMCQPCSKITALKDAATDLVDILFGDEETLDDLWIGIVPFSQTVNVGTDRTAWRDATHYAGLNYYFAGHEWLGCFEERYGANNRDVTDDPPSVEQFRTYFAPDTNSFGANNWRSSGGADLRDPDDDIWANAYCPESVLTPLTNEKQTLIDAIADLDTGGNTHVNVGAVWGWRLLSPQWRGVWGGDMDADNRPLDYNDETSQKAVILMTDGVNTMSSGIYTAYGFLSAGNLGTTSSTTAKTKLNQKTTAVCNSMKAQGIIIYTILFMEDDATAVALMKGCASEEDYFFESATAEELETAFHTIGDALSELRISK
jgi:Flp pilus assembly protein TadG